MYLNWGVVEFVKGCWWTRIILLGIGLQVGVYQVCLVIRISVAAVFVSQSELIAANTIDDYVDIKTYVTYIIK